MKDYPNLAFPTEQQLRESEDAKYEMSEWILDRDNYILNNHRLPFPWLDEGKFVMHCLHVECPGDEKKAFQIIVNTVITIDCDHTFDHYVTCIAFLYKELFMFWQLTVNAHGDNLAPVIVHNGCITDSLLERYKGKLGFVESADGNVNFQAVMEATLNLYECVIHIISIFMISTINCL